MKLIKFSAIILKYYNFQTKIPKILNLLEIYYLLSKRGLQQIEKLINRGGGLQEKPKCNKQGGLLDSEE